MDQSDDHTDQIWGAPRPEQRWGRRETVAAVGVAAVIGVLGGGAVYAATANTGHGGPGFGGPGFGGPPAGAMEFGGGPPGGHASGSHSDARPDSVHSEVVVANGDGGFTTEVTQVGTLTAVSPTSITARSADGFTATYVIPPTVGQSAVPFAVNDKVSIRATREGGVDTVTTIGAPIT